MIVGLNHAQITVPVGKEAEAREFYCGFLGLVEIPKPVSLAGRGGLWVRAGTMPVHIGTEDGVNRAATKAHLAFEVSDLASWKSAFEKKGIEILDGIPIPGFDRFEFRDPFGNRMELIQPLQ